MFVGLYASTVEAMTQTLQTRQQRINMNRVSPEVYEAMVAMSAAAAKDIDPGLAELIKIRASQLNHCGLWRGMHTHGARECGETEPRIYLLSAWREAGDVFT